MLIFEIITFLCFCLLILLFIAAVLEDVYIVKSLANIKRAFSSLNNFKDNQDVL
jgi:hypothetical protein